LSSPQRPPVSQPPSVPAAEPGSEHVSEQQQSQTQTQVVTLNLQNSSDPGLEVEILGELHSAGRQLGRLSSVVDLLLRVQEDHPALRDPAATQVVTAFRSMRDDIERAKRARRPDKYIEEFERLRAKDPEAFAHLTRELRDWLERTPG